jgi:hypothetical protein
MAEAIAAAAAVLGTGKVVPSAMLQIGEALAALIRLQHIYNF